MQTYVANLDVEYNSEESVVKDWQLLELYGDSPITGNGIIDFMSHIIAMPRSKNNVEIFIHNLDFVGCNILDYLERTGEFVWVGNEDELSEHNYTGMLSKNNSSRSIMKIILCTRLSVPRNPKKPPNRYTVTIYNSNNLYPLSLEDIKRIYNLNGIEAVHYAVSTIDRYNLLKHSHKTNMTISQASANNLKDFFGADEIARLYCPTGNITGRVFDDMANAHFGGYLYINEKYIDKNVSGFVIDNNGLYAHVMEKYAMPYGEPKWFDGDYYSKKNERYHKTYPYYIQHVTGKFVLRPNKLPAIPISDDYMNGEINVKYLEDTAYDSCTSLWLTNYDMELLRTHYYKSAVSMDKNEEDTTDVYKCVGGYMFQAKPYLKPWVQMWNEERIKAIEQCNKGSKILCKLVPNSVSGKFASGKHDYHNIRPILNDSESLQFVEENKVVYIRHVKQRYFDKKEKKWKDLKSVKTKSNPNYIPLSIFITSIARYITITTAQKVVDYSIKKYGESRYIYSDTDSIHFELDHIPPFIEINDREVGKWKIEYEFDSCRYIGLKTYYLQHEGKEPKIVCAGLPRDSLGEVNFDNFRQGHRYKVYETSTVKGGACKKEYEFTVSSKFDLAKFTSDTNRKAEEKPKNPLKIYIEQKTP